MRTFLLKTEPSEYAFSDLLRDGRTIWTGVANPGALIALRSAARGDLAFIYHTAHDKAIVGLAEFASDPYPDPDQPGTTPDGQPKHAVIDLTPIKASPAPVTLAAIKADHRFSDFALVKQPRLSVMLVPPDLAAILRKLAKL